MDTKKEIMEFFFSLPFALFHSLYSVLITGLIGYLLKNELKELLLILNVIIFGFLFFLFAIPSLPYIMAMKTQSLGLPKLIYGLELVLLPFLYFRFLKGFYFKKN
ncbi:MAG: hypothetical protein H7A25_09740 [Leptospiraceae bacterium]|nr:hypothetical protein [Leptospiraceae bacterium]